MTLREVAKRAGVSTATVSRVMNKSGIVRGATRRRVLRAAKELHYLPILHARSLAGAKSRTIGMIVSEIESSLFEELTSSNIPRRKIGQIAFEALVQKQSNDLNANHEVVIDPELLIRESTGPAPER